MIVVLGLRSSGLVGSGARAKPGSGVKRPETLKIGKERPNIVFFVVALVSLQAWSIFVPLG